MSEPVFFRRGRSLTIGQLAKLTEARLQSVTLPDLVVFDIASLERAGPNDLAYADRPNTAPLLRSTQAAACLVTETLAGDVPRHTACLIVNDPYRAFVAAAAALFPDALRPSSLFEIRGAAPTALVHPEARIEVGVTIDPGAVVGPRAEVGGGTLIGPMAVVGPNVRIGRDCVIGPGASITNALIGDHVIVCAGSRIGEGAFNHVANSARQERPPRLGRVIIQDRVEIGANSTIDCGGDRDTVIGERSRIDNLVHVASDVVIGRHCIIVSVPDADTILSGNPTDAGVVTFGDGARIAAAAVARQPH